MKVSLALLGFVAAVAGHGDHDHDQEPIVGPLEGLWYNTLPGDGGTQVQSPPREIQNLNSN
jgi:agmatinase